ncbi:ejaculatory bulb-specific protein 3 [Bemisia tabaci]
MSKYVFVLCVVAALAAVVSSADDFYSDKYDNIDLDSILASKRLIRNYMNCFQGKSPCTPEGTYLNQVLPEALKTECAKCTEKQREGAVKAIKKLSAEYPEEWKEITDKLDPTGEQYAKFKARFP